MKRTRIKPKEFGRQWPQDQELHSSDTMMELSIYIEMKKSKEYIGRRTENQTVSIEAEDEFLHCCIFAFA